MAIQVGDRVTHETIGQKMVVIGLGDFSGRPIASCEWTDLNGEKKQNQFPESELIKRP